MQKILTFILFLLIFNNLSAQDFNLELLANIPNTEETGDANDIWAYIAPDSTEYAVIGHFNGTAIYDLTKPTDPVLVKFIPGSGSIWRDIKHYNEKVYVTTDQRFTTDGLLIVDMSMAPDSISFEFWKPTILNDPLETCHNLYIDEKGFLYLTGCADFRVSNLASGGVLMFDLNQGDLPVFLNAIENRYAHDIFVQNDIAYASNIYVGEFSIWDISDKANPVLLGRQATSRNFTHNAWASHDGNFLFTTDEKSFANIDAYDISESDNIERIDTYRPKDTEKNLTVPHNVHYLNGYLVASYYTEGLKIIDANRPSNLIEVGSFDTFFSGDGGTKGCWGATPFLPSGLVLGSDIKNGLFVFKPTYERACYLEGTVKDRANNNAIMNTNIIIDSDFVNEVNSNFEGVFKTGQSEAGEFDINIKHPEYFDTAITVILIPGEVVNQDILLRKRPVYDINLTVLDNISSAPIQAADVEIMKDFIVDQYQTDNVGQLMANSIGGEVNIATGKWGYKFDLSPVILNENRSIEIRLTEGYEDNFFSDLGWTVSSDPDMRGEWERVSPVGTERAGVAINPFFDGQDYSDKAYITGNGGGGSRFDDVDGGPTILQSPLLDLSSFENPILEFEVWRWVESNNGFEGEGLQIAVVSNNIKTYIDTIAGRVDAWELMSYNLEDFVTISDNMHISFEATDDNSNPQLDFRTEIGIDNFRIKGADITAVDNLFTNLSISAVPNPFQDKLEINFIRDEISNENIKLDIFNVMGQKMEERQINGNLNTIIINTNIYPKGLYFIQLSGNNWKTQAYKVVKQ